MQILKKKKTDIKPGLGRRVSEWGREKLKRGEQENRSIPEVNFEQFKNQSLLKMILLPRLLIAFNF